MKRVAVVLSAIMFAAVLSAAFVLLSSLSGRSYISTLLASKPAPPPTLMAPPIFQPLNVVDDSRRVLSYEEQQALFASLGDRTRDPISMQVRKLRRDGKYMVCGEMNSKNGFGGYVGFLPFVAVTAPGTTLEIMVMGEDDRELAEQYPDYRAKLATLFDCTNSPLNVIDDTQNILDVNEQKELFFGLSERLEAPSIQVRNLIRGKDDGVCGEVNGKDKLGNYRYVGFSRFIAALGSSPEAAVVIFDDKEKLRAKPDFVAMAYSKVGCPY